MTPEIRRAALRAAAKTALFAMVGTGCGGASVPAPAPVAASGGACVEYLATLPTTDPRGLPEGDPDRDIPTFYTVFKNPADRHAERTLTCCRADLTAHGAQASQRFACCAALGNQLPADAEQSACTPWGPPCPPELDDPAFVARAVA